MTCKALEYAQGMQAILERIIETQIEKIDRAAEIVANAIAGDGILYTFGTGHSHVIAEDVAYRAGGLAPVDAILEALSHRPREGAPERIYGARRRDGGCNF